MRGDEIDGRMRDLLVYECGKCGFSYASNVLADPAKYGDSHWTQLALRAMRNAFELGRAAGGRYGWQHDVGSVSSDPAPHASRPSVPTGKTGNFNIP